MTFTGFGSYHMDSYDYDEYIATVYSMHFNIRRHIWYFCY